MDLRAALKPDSLPERDALRGRVSCRLSRMPLSCGSLELSERRPWAAAISSGDDASPEETVETKTPSSFVGDSDVMDASVSMLGGCCTTDMMANEVRRGVMCACLKECSLPLLL